MNLPNKLTIARILMIPVCLLFLLLKWNTVATLVFLLTCFTDFLDGYIARSQNLVTNFGKFADPVADKILVLSCMAVLLYQHLLPWWVVVVVIVRELAVDGLRLVAVEQGVVIPAGQLGKVKTTVQMACVVASMLAFPYWLVILLSLAVCALTILSGAEYFKGAKHLLLQ